MVDLTATNQKMRERSIRLVRSFTELSEGDAAELLRSCDGELKTAIVLRPVRPRRRFSSCATIGVRRALTRGNRAAITTMSERKTKTVIGVDGGGTSTTAIVARLVDGGEPEYLARGNSGPANPKVVGWEMAMSAIRQAIDAATTQASNVADVDRFAAACITVAGCGREEDQSRLMGWLDDQKLADAHLVVDDGQAVLRAGVPQGIGVAVIAGTGSFVIGRNRRNQTARAGGWGYLLGDAGSGYAIGLEGLKAVVQASDCVGPSTELSEVLLGACGVSESAGLIQLVYGEDFSRTEIAALAPIVLEVADQGDEVALSIVRSQLHHLERQVRAVSTRLDMKDDDYHIALAGGVLVNNETFRSRLVAQLQVTDDRVAVVDEPAQGAVLLAANMV